MKVSPKKSLGQHFLINPRMLDKIVAAAEITKDDIILEVGPGTGNLTEKLATKARKVIAIEKDKRLIEELRNKFRNSNIEIVAGDILKHFDISKYQSVKEEGYKIVANIPYYITSRFLRKIFTEWPQPKLVVLTIQKEVAQRIMAKPPKMNLLALSVQFFAEPKIIGYISKENFRPRPKIDSALLRIKLRRAQQSKKFTERFFKIAKAGFSQKRKLLINNLSKKFDIMKKELLEIFVKIGVNQNIRAESLSLNQWIELTKYIEK